MTQEDSLAYEFVTSKLYDAAREKFLPTHFYDKATDYIDTVKALIDRDTRASTAFQVGTSVLLSIGSKAVGSSLENHPYFALHKAHLQALSAALNAQASHNNAIEAMDRAARAADGTDDIAAESRKLLAKMRDLRFEFGYKGGFAPEGDSSPSTYIPAVFAQVRVVTSALSTGASVVAWQLATAEWQSRVCRVYLDGVKLMSMARVEWQVARRGGELFQAKLDAMLKSSSQISVVAGYATMQDQQWAQFDRMKAQSEGKATGSPQAITDPGRYAAGNVRDVEAVVQKLAALCDAAMSTRPIKAKADRMAHAL